MNMSYSPYPGPALYQRLAKIEAQLNAVDLYIEQNRAKLSQGEICEKAAEWGWQIERGGKHPYKAVREGWRSIPIAGHGTLNLGKGIALRIVKDLAKPYCRQLKVEKQGIKRQLEEIIKVERMQAEIDRCKQTIEALEKEKEVVLDLALETENLASKTKKYLSQRIAKLTKDYFNYNALKDQLKALKAQITYLMKERAEIENKWIVYIDKVDRQEEVIENIRKLIMKYPQDIREELLNCLEKNNGV